MIKPQSECRIFSGAAELAPDQAPDQAPGHHGMGQASHANPACNPSQGFGKGAVVGNVGPAQMAILSQSRRVIGVQLRSRRQLAHAGGQMGGGAAGGLLQKVFGITKPVSGGFGPERASQAQRGIKDNRKGAGAQQQIGLIVQIAGCQGRR